jgi:hypothetical protein
MVFMVAACAYLAYCSRAETSAAAHALLTGTRPLYCGLVDHVSESGSCLSYMCAVEELTRESGFECED